MDYFSYLCIIIRSSRIVFKLHLFSALRKISIHNAHFSLATSLLSLITSFSRGQLLKFLRIVPNSFFFSLTLKYQIVKTPF